VNGSKILILGVAYKADIEDTRESPALDVMDHLTSMGAEVAYHDPHVPAFDVGDLHLESEDISGDALDDFDCVVLVTNHAGLEYARILDQARLVVDTRNAWKGVESPKLFRV
jgi:UDP-N-acetyl-D-glucosamine dehydrogenase